VSEPTAGRPMDDDLDQAYARSHALAGEGRGPSASVRANVLAAAARIAAGEVADAAPLVPVAPPVAAVERKRGPAVNLSSWRVRAGAGLCALLLVCAGVWRFDQNGRLGGGVQVALAELRLAEPRTAAAPAAQALPVPAAAAASYPYAAPPEVVVDPFDGNAGVRGPTAKHAEREREVVVAQLDEQRPAAARHGPPPDGASPSSRAVQTGVAPAPAAADTAAPPRPLALDANAPRTQDPPGEQESATVAGSAATPAAPPGGRAAPPRSLSALPRRMMLVPHPSPALSARSAPSGNTVVASADTGGFPADARRTENGFPPPADARAEAAPAPAAAPAPVVVAGAMAAAPEPAVQAGADGRLPSNADALKRSKADVAGLRQAPAGPDALQAAADRGDVDRLKALLAGPAVRVDVPDADGRTALLHAVLAQRPEAVRLLLAAGADPGRADHAGLTPRQAAQVGASAEIAALLGAAR